MSQKRKGARQGSAPRHLAPAQTQEHAADLHLVAAWRHPDDPKAQRDFRRRYRNAWIRGGGNWDPDDRGVLSLTLEEAERRDMMRSAERLEDAAKCEARKAPPYPRNPVDAGSAESIEWRVSTIYTPRILELAQRARALIAADHWSAARPLILEAELERERANQMLRRPEERRKSEELRELASSKKKLVENFRQATAERCARAANRRTWVHKRAAELLAQGCNRVDLANVLSRELAAKKRDKPESPEARFPDSERVIRRDLESFSGRATPRVPRSRP